ncbi:hypothetical protein B0H19DRAFT_199724 [Mycena capillaripes]|nr:hypothetical protein B0H19DRAFT_199724 [Mycena capillaripes]
MARRRATVKTLPPAVQEEFKERARASRAKYREQNRHLLMYKAQCHRRTRLTERLKAHIQDGSSTHPDGIPHSNYQPLPAASSKDGRPDAITFHANALSPACATRHPPRTNSVMLSHSMRTYRRRSSNSNSIQPAIRSKS